MCRWHILYMLFTWKSLVCVEIQKSWYFWRVPPSWIWSQLTQADSELWLKEGEKLLLEERQSMSLLQKKLPDSASFFKKNKLALMPPIQRYILVLFRYSVHIFSSLLVAECGNSWGVVQWSELEAFLSCLRSLYTVLPGIQEHGTHFPLSHVTEL